jgi:hypothetical protein
MAFSQNLKKQFRSFFEKRDIAQLVQNQQVVTGILLDDALQVFVLPGFDQLIGQAIASDKTDTEAVFTGFDAQGGGYIGLVGAAVIRENNIATLPDVIAARKLPDQPNVQIRHGRQIKGFQHFDQSKLCVSNPAGKTNIAVWVQRCAAF